MRIALVGPGIMPIPPPGWGAVEILIWDYYLELTRQGFTVDIINQMRQSDQEQKHPYSNYCQTLIRKINEGNYDFVHIHYDCLYAIMPFLKCPRIGISSHYPYIDQIDKHQSDGYSETFKYICKNNSHTIFAISQKDMDIFIQYAQNPKNVMLMLNGVDSNSIQPCTTRSLLNKSVYIGKVEPRKQQDRYMSLNNLDFYGTCSYFHPLYNQDSYKGELEHSKMMKCMSEYGNLVLLSLGENGTPLVVKEALMAGLPVVINEHSINDLDTTQEFIDVIPREKWYDYEYVQSIIDNNRKKQNVETIRNYALQNFSWMKLIQIYIKNILNITPNANFNHWSKYTDTSDGMGSR